MAVNTSTSTTRREELFLDTIIRGCVRRWSGPAAGLIAGAVLALTPVASLMFRFNNPDALLVLLLIAAAYCMVRATETASTRWIALAGCAVGFAFLTKMLQAFLVVPGLALVFLVAAPVGLWQRIGKLLVGAAAMVVSAGWYVALVSLWPAGSRPYIAGSTDNSLLQLALGYNGIERITGNEGGPGGGPGGHGGMNVFFGGSAGIGRLFGPSMGFEASRAALRYGYESTKEWLTDQGLPLLRRLQATPEAV